jgi:hypothetical protein
MATGSQGSGAHGDSMPDPHRPREIARAQRWADGGLASSVVGWDRERPVPTEDDRGPEHGRGTMFGVALGVLFVVVLAVAMVAASLGIGSPSPESSAIAADDGARPDGPELTLAVADGVELSAVQLEAYREALDVASDECGQSREDIAAIARNVSDSAQGYDAELSGLELLRALPEERAAGQDCAETAADVLASQFD